MNSSCINSWSHYLGLSPSRIINKLPNNLFTALVWPSIWEWYTLLNCSVVPNFFHSVFKKWIINLLSLYDVILIGNPCNLIISLKKSLAILITLLVFLYSIKWAFFKNLSMTTNTELLHLYVLGNPNNKSIEMSSHGSSGTGNRLYSLTFYDCPLATWHILHYSINFHTCFLSPRKK